MKRAEYKRILQEDKERDQARMAGLMQQAGDR